MKPLDTVPDKFKVELTRQEVEYIREITQNPMNIEDQDVCLGLFVGASRLLGYDIDDLGRIKRISNPQYHM